MVRYDLRVRFNFRSVNFTILISLFKIQSQEVEETLKRIASHKGVVGTVVVNNEGRVNQTIFSVAIPSNTIEHDQIFISGIDR